VASPGSNADAPRPETTPMVTLTAWELANMTKRGLLPIILVTPDMAARLRDIPGAIR